MPVIDMVKEKIKVEVNISTVQEMSAGGNGRSKWFALNDFDNHADFFNAALAHIQNVWGENSPSMRLTHIFTDMPHLGLVSEHGADKDIWLLMEMGDVNQVKMVEAYINIFGKHATMKDTIQNAIDLSQGYHESDESCVDQYISEFGSIEEADPTISLDLTKAEYTEHFMKGISHSNGHYFNN